MQNLPFLVTQNAPLQKSGSTTANQKLAETGTSFKQVLSKQVEQEPAPEQLTKKTKLQKVHNQSQQLQLKNTGMQTAVQNATNIEKAADFTVSEDIALPTLGLSKTDDELTQHIEGMIPAEKLDRETTEAAATVVSQETNAALVASLQLPALNITNAVPVAANTVQGQEALTGVASLKSDQQADTGSKLPLKQDLKTVLLDDKQVSSSNKNKEKSTEIGENGKNLLENVLPKTNKSTENSEQISTKFASKLTTELAIKPAQEPSVKVVQESMLTQAATSISAVATQTATQLSSAQAGSGNTINAYPGKLGWDQAISQKVVWMVGAAEQSATLTLNPPDLGPLQVVISVNNDKADTTFISENPEVRKVLENGISTLRNLMDQAGVQLGQANVSTGKQQQEFEQAARARSSQQMLTNTASQSAENPASTRTIMRSSNGLVDTFA